MMKCSVSISISFEPKLLAAINEYCSEKGCSRSWLVNKAVTEYFASLEDQEDYETAVTVLDEFEKSIEDLNPKPNPYAKKLKNQK